MFSKNKKLVSPKSSPGHARYSFENLLEHVRKRGRKFWLKIRYKWNKVFSHKTYLWHINCRNDNCRKPSKESPKTFRPNPRITNNRVITSGRKNPSSKPSGYVDFSFNLFTIKFRTFFTKRFAQNFQQKYSLDKLTHNWT